MTLPESSRNLANSGAESKLAFSASDSSTSRQYHASVMDPLINHLPENSSLPTTFCSSSRLASSSARISFSSFSLSSSNSASRRFLSSSSVSLPLCLSRLSGSASVSEG